MKSSNFQPVLAATIGLVVAGEAPSQTTAGEPEAALTLASSATSARAPDGSYISWREHLIDDEALGGLELRGSDGLAVADLDGDGYEDVVSVHESDDQYDGVAEGHIRIAFGTADPDRWNLVTLADGPEAGAAEDVAIGDVNGDGLPDVIAACELAHLIYFQNPGRTAQSGEWPRHIPAVTLDRGSFIRVFLADLNADGRPEVVTPNKGAQDPTQARQEPRAISFFEITGDPLDDEAWIEHVLTEIPWPINSQPVDLDSDGDIDVVGGSVAAGTVFWFENVGTGNRFAFEEHAIEIGGAAARPAAPGAAGPADDSPPTVNGFNMEFVDLSGDGRLDIVTFDTDFLLGLGPVWLEQPETFTRAWTLHQIGDYGPDQLVGILPADIDGDGDTDLMTGGYSRGSRTADGVADAGAALGRLAWFENAGNASAPWRRHDFSRRERGMFDKFVARDIDGDGDVDFFGTRGNSGPYDGVFWLEQRRSDESGPAFSRARGSESPEIPLP